VHTEPLITWPEPLLELLGFLAAFLAAGAIGFRFTALRGALAGAASDAERGVLARAGSRAARLGLTGTLVTAVLFALQVPGLAARRHLSVAGELASPPLALQVALLALAALGFVLAYARRPAGWPLAAVAVLVAPLRNALGGQWTRLVVPLHSLAGGLWIGTLFLLVTVGLAAVLADGLPGDRRGALAAHMVNAFSPLALTSAGFLATFGVITAWLHLKRLEALWTTPYGVTLIVKLCVVGVVLALGAWNWRRQRPRLGSEAGARALRGSATVELAVAGVVLAITSILVSLPSPR